MKAKPDFIRHWHELEAAVEPPVGETFGYASEFAPATDLAHLRVAHLRLPPGARAYPPIALRDDEAFFFVLEGTPDLWIDGHLHRLKEGDGVTLNAKTGIAHSFLNNSDRDVRLFAMSEAPRQTSRAFHPVDEAANANLRAAGRLWDAPPARKLGAHDGLTDARRGAASAADTRKFGKPSFVVHWRSVLGPDEGNTYPASAEKHGIDASFGKRAKFSRIGVHVEVLPAGRRTSWPHAERDEEEYLYVVSGSLDCWTDGHIHPISEGDFVGWASGTATTHVVINNGDEDAVLIVGGEASRMKNRYFYPLHPRRNEEIGELHWDDHAKNKLGPHDGLPDRLRETVPAHLRKDAIKANAAAAYGAGKGKKAAKPAKRKAKPAKKNPRTKKRKK